MVLGELPRFDRLVMATVTRVPDWHPEYESFEPFPVFAWVLHHPDGAVLFDTGIGSGNDLIDEWYAPESIDLGDALAAVGVEPGEVAAVVLSHLHFDHCGQQAMLNAPVYVSAEEHRVARQPFYTVDAWAAIPPARLRLVGDDFEVARGVSIVATPGHTPGHQSMVVRAGSATVVFGGQCAYRAVEVRTGEPSDTNLHSPDWRDTARASLQRVRALGPAEVHLSHDGDVIRL